MNPTAPTAAGKTATPVAIIGRDMRAVVGAEPSAPHASTQRTLPGLTVTLSRSLNHWMLTLHSDDAPIQPPAADLWAAAVGAPSLDWWRTRQGRRWMGEWVEGERL